MHEMLYYVYIAIFMAYMGMYAAHRQSYARIICKPVCHGQGKIK